ncbi:18829_t:CDS:2, partial [Funneliformis geosporum]
EDLIETSLNNSTSLIISVEIIFKKSFECPLTFIKETCNFKGNNYMFDQSLNSKV